MKGKRILVSVDEHTQVAMEIVSQGTKLSEELILKILQSLSDLLSGENKEKQNFVIKDNTKEGKQKISELVDKHKDGVVALDENITKQQLNDYQKEFKKLGVDFSVVKNGKDNYSFFFASEQANIIEKALKNIVESKNNVLENEQVKNLQSDVNNLKEEIPKEKVSDVKDLFDKSFSPENKSKINSINEQLNKLSSKEKLLFSKLKELDELKNTLYIQEIKRVENLYYGKESVANDNKAVPSTNKEDIANENNAVPSANKEDIAIQNTSLSPEKNVESILNQLTAKEQTLFIQLNKAKLESLDNYFADKSTHNEANALKKLEENFSKAEIKKVYTLHSDKIFSGTGSEPKELLHAGELNAIVKNIEKEKQATKQIFPSMFSMKGVKEIDNKIKEEMKDLGKDKNRSQSLSR